MKTCIQFYLKSTKLSNIEFFTKTTLKIVEDLGGNISFISLPTKIKRISVLSSPHVYKKFKDHYEAHTYMRIIKIILPNNSFEFVPFILKKKPFELSCKIITIKN